MKAALRLLILCIGLFLICPSCTYKLSLSGSSIPPAMKTIRVDFFENNAQLVVNTLSTQFTEALKDRIRTTTSLSIVRSEEADGVMSGSITDYNIAPVSVLATNPNVAPIAGASQLTITVSVKYVSNLDKKNNFEQSFTKSLPFSGDINTQEQTLITAINKQLTEDIFNKAFSNW
ncbi:MAG: hypothetical protein JWQ63_1982 [Mucilaginibacter sp.]|jgi:hypothetical protein|nr:hypothetical protein [Mucilaginibacter sp.]